MLFTVARLHLILVVEVISFTLARPPIPEFDGCSTRNGTCASLGLPGHPNNVLAYGDGGEITSALPGAKCLTVNAAGLVNLEPWLGRVGGGSGTV